MCFISRCDWRAEVCDEGTRIVEEGRFALCCECDARIDRGGTVHTLDMQQYEECHHCTEGKCECPKDKDDDCRDGCSCAEPDYGETYSWECCNDCFRFLKAVQAAEVAAGCDYSESSPSLEKMVEEISDGGADEAKKYFKTAVRMFPDLKVSGYLGRLWKRMFGG